ncbi:Protein of uncharacterised function (DUF2798) [Comamonas testosteroni]|uniref:Protein of uncharacterized function (DUF2798) n=2 Tax=Comamonadaceae TaxID=80864 RepID=A0A8B4S2G2_COMTE|nr:uncharacterized protein DUF2798 [Comamonas sp. AG1104]SUY76231.1 Protein of uncharacterised function (DUF2798) [Comamonas testosteroni]
MHSARTAGRPYSRRDDAQCISGIAFMNSSNSSSPSRLSTLKLHRRYTPFVFAFFMAGIMAFLMCCTIVAANTGFDTGYVRRVFSAYALAMPVAFFCVMMVRPLVLKLVALTVHTH